MIWDDEFGDDPPSTLRITKRGAFCAGILVPVICFGAYQYASWTDHKRTDPIYVVADCGGLTDGP